MPLNIGRFAFILQLVTRSFYLLLIYLSMAPFTQDEDHRLVWVYPDVIQNTNPHQVNTLLFDLGRYKLPQFDEDGNQCLTKHLVS